MKQRVILLVLAIIFLILLFLEPRFSWITQSFLRNAFWRISSSQNNDNELLKENIVLRAQLVQNNSHGAIPSFLFPTIQASVYSRYPFNFKNELTVSAGVNQGVELDQAVLLPIKKDATSTNAFNMNGLLIGRISKVFQNESIVQTILDSQWHLTVLIGSNGDQALFVGGTQPMLTLVDKKASIKDGEVVYSIDSRIPYGLPIGTTKDVRINDQQTFQEAKLAFPYDLNNAKSVLIVKHVPATQ